MKRYTTEQKIVKIKVLLMRGTKYVLNLQSTEARLLCELKVVLIIVAKVALIMVIYDADSYLTFL